VFANMFGGLKRGLFGDSSRSKSTAKSRLQFVLVQDRAGMSSDEMTKFKKELMGVIEKYFKIEKNKFDIAYKRDGEMTTLLINSPVMVKRAGEAGSSANGSKPSMRNEMKDAAPAAAANESA
jgi:cell division topological specificity factor